MNAKTIWLDEVDNTIVHVIDQRRLPHQIVIEDLNTCDDVVRAIADMLVRGAPLIGVTASFGIYLSLLGAANDRWKKDLEESAAKLLASRPTAVNLRFAIENQLMALKNIDLLEDAIDCSLKTAQDFLKKDIFQCEAIGEHGLTIMKSIVSSKKGGRLNVLTHCNAGWLACVEWGTATAPLYKAHDAGMNFHVWVDETRPRNQGAQLTAWELGERGIPHTVIADNTGGI